MGVFWMFRQFVRGRRNRSQSTSRRIYLRRKRSKSGKQFFRENNLHSHNFREGLGGLGRWGKPRFLHTIFYLIFIFFQFIYLFLFIYYILSLTSTFTQTTFLVTQLLPTVTHTIVRLPNHRAYTIVVPPWPPRIPSSGPSATPNTPSVV